MRTRGTFVQKFAKELAEQFPEIVIPALNTLITEWQHSQIYLSADNWREHLFPFLAAIKQHHLAMLGTSQSLRLHPESVANRAYALLEMHLRAVAFHFGEQPASLITPIKVGDFAKRVLTELTQLSEDPKDLPPLVSVESQLSVAALQTLLMEHINSDTPIVAWNINFFHAVRLLCTFRQLRTEGLDPEKWPNTKANQIFKFLEACYLDTIPNCQDNLLKPVKLMFRDVRKFEAGYICDAEKELLLEMRHVFVNMFACLSRTEWQACVDKISLANLYMLLADGEVSRHVGDTDDADAFFKDMDAHILSKVEFTEDNQQINDARIFLMFALASKRYGLSEWRSNSAAELITSIFSRVPTRGERLADVKEVISQIIANCPLSELAQKAENSSSPLHKYRRTLKPLNGSQLGLNSDTHEKLLSLIPKAIIKITLKQAASVPVVTQAFDFGIGQQRKRAFPR